MGVDASSVRQKALRCPRGGVLQRGDVLSILLTAPVLAMAIQAVEWMDLADACLVIWRQMDLW